MTAIAVCCTAMASESSACETSAHSAIECVKDNESSSPDGDVLRANITDERHACSWVEDYGLKTNTSWVVDFVNPAAKSERELIASCHILLAQALERKNFGKDEYPLLKIAEKMPLYAKHDNSLKALIEQLRRVHAEEKSNAAYRRHLLSGTKRLRILQEQKRGVGAMMAMDAALGLELRRARYITVQPTAISSRRPRLTRGSKRVAAGRPASGPSPKRAKKRRHVLQRSVSLNIPHVKLHGYVH
ncbi:hypothetical protein HPB51_015520 [Rhipicephalus microplus]|uniref:Uncharacterized protein n=1 Tax=Rhipicephalus microplus TaxID=6941 RepID=A0A9J6ENP5_RHIMP|nr:hypothetical protein HPB51_015520 [Rhipicephalus microplus]